MSHTVAADFTGGPPITNLEALAAAAERCGLAFFKDQLQFRTYGKHEPCLHAIGLPVQQRSGTERDYTRYEIGVREVAGAKGQYALFYDPFGEHIDRLATDEKAGQLSKLYMFYQIEEAKTLAKTRKMVFRERVEVDGSITCEAVAQRSF